MTKLSHSTNLLLHRVFNGIADSTIKVFIPLLIYKSTGSLLLAFLYGIINHFVNFVLFFAMKPIIQKKPTLSIILHIVPIIIAELILLKDINIASIIILALLDSISTTLYFGALNLVFATLDKDVNASKFDSGQYIGKILFTILSAYILGEIVNSLVFIIIFSLSLYVMSIIPIAINYKEINSKLSILPKTNITTVLKDNKLFNLYHSFTGIFSFFIEFILPLYLYVSGLSLTVVGIIVALQYLLNIIANALSKYLQNHNQLTLSFILSSIIMFVCLTIIMISKNSILIYIMILILGFVYHIIFTPLYGLFILTQKEKGFFHDSMFYRDCIQNISRSITGSIYVLFPYFTVMFAFGLASSIGIGIASTGCLKQINYR